MAGNLLFGVPASVRSRVVLLRSLLAKPELLWLDEPFSTLGAAPRADIRRFGFEHAKRPGLATLMVTHDAADADVARGPVGVLE